MGDYEVRDNWGRRIGTARPVGQDSGCGCFILLAIALLIGGVSLCQAISNFFNYHEFTFNTSEAQRHATATAAAPYHFYADATTAQRGGNASIINNPDNNTAKDVALGKDDSITFTNVSEPESSEYALIIYVDALDASKDFTIDIIVNGQLQLKIDGGKLDRSADANLQPKVRLNKGDNTIELFVKNVPCYESGSCATIDVNSIVLDAPGLTDYPF